MSVTGRGILHIKGGVEHQVKGKKIIFHTSLGEESAESVIGVGLLALLSEESIGLSTVLVASVYLSARK